MSLYKTLENLKNQASVDITTVNGWGFTGRINSISPECLFLKSASGKDTYIDIEKIICVEVSNPKEREAVEKEMKRKGEPG